MKNPFFEVDQYTYINATMINTVKVDREEKGASVLFFFNDQGDCTRSYQTIAEAEAVRDKFFDFIKSL